MTDYDFSSVINCRSALKISDKKRIMCQENATRYSVGRVWSSLLTSVFHAKSPKI